jgi:hypothetical protein
MSVINFNFDSSRNNKLTLGTDGNSYVLSDTDKEDYVCSKCSKVAQTLFVLGDKVICERCKMMHPEARKLDEFVQSKLKRLNVVCPNSVRGCHRDVNSPMKVSELKDHLTTCQNEIIYCEFHDVGCTEKTTRSQMNNHASTCRFRSNAEVIFLIVIYYLVGS